MDCKYLIQNIDPRSVVQVKRNANKTADFLANSVRNIKEEGTWENESPFCLLAPLHFDALNITP